MPRRPRILENRIISKCLVLLGLHADSCKPLRTWVASTNLKGELGKTEFGSPSATLQEIGIGNAIRESVSH